MSVTILFLKRPSNLSVPFRRPAQVTPAQAAPKFIAFNTKTLCARACLGAAVVRLEVLRLGRPGEASRLRPCKKSEASQRLQLIAYAAAIGLFSIQYPAAGAASGRADGLQSASDKTSASVRLAERNPRGPCRSERQQAERLGVAGSPLHEPEHSAAQERIQKQVAHRAEELLREKWSNLWRLALDEQKGKTGTPRWTRMRKGWGRLGKGWAHSEEH